MSEDVYQLPDLATANTNDLFKVFQQSDNTFRRFNLVEAATSYGWELEVVKTVTTAELLALFTTPIEIIPAPGANLAIVPTMWACRKIAGTAYAGIAAGEDLQLKYTDASGAAASALIEPTGFLDQTSAELRTAQGINASVEPVANAALVLHLLVGEIITGDTDLEVLVRYKLLPTDFAGA